MPYNRVRRSSMKRSITILLLLSITALTSCTTGSRNPSSEREFKRIDKEVQRLDHELHRSGVI